MIDQTDWQIIQCLQKDSRMQWQDIGKLVHLTGQAVAARIRRLQSEGIIRAFTIDLDYEKLGTPILAFVTVFMSSSNHVNFQQFITRQPSVTEAYRVSGEGCYWLKAQLKNQAELNLLLDEILAFGNYRVNLSLGKIKQL